ncbi:MAG: methyltransferase domain-containing protein [Gammaproteobacteria bacterium]|nr:methyltransferase domain-containing protein [Gammaproteobacteria bacterium]
MDFASTRSQRIYSDRRADPSWLQWCTLHLAPAGRAVVDIGCGGGIYSRGFAELGAASVVGVDQSEQYLGEASASVAGLSGVRFCRGSAVDTGLADACADIVFERALIHHLSRGQQSANAREAHRLLRGDGRLCVQDRSYEDVTADDPDFWIRATLFELFPGLLEFERARRPTTEDYTRLLGEAGFGRVQVLHLAETRRRYADIEELAAEILSRKGKSILFELDDAQLAAYAHRLRERGVGQVLTERDRWTIWLADR